MKNSFLLYLLIAFCGTLRAQQPFTPGIRHQLIFSAGTVYNGNGKMYFTGAYEYELNRRFTLELKGGLDMGDKADFLDYGYDNAEPLVNGNPDDALAKFQVSPDGILLATLSPRLQFNLRQNPRNRIWIAAGPVGAFVRSLQIAGYGSTPNQLTKITTIYLQRYLTWGLNGELGYNLKINKALFCSANAGAMLIPHYGQFTNPSFYATLGIGINLGGYPKTVQE